MKKIIILLGIAISMYVLSESNKNTDEGWNVRTEEEQQTLDEERKKELDKVTQRTLEEQRILDQGYGFKERESKKYSLY